MEKEPKQILNKEIIKIDLKNYYIENIKGVALIFAMLLPLLPIFLIFLPDMGWQTFALCVIIILIYLGFLCAIIYNIKKLVDVSKGKFKVVFDTLLCTRTYHTRNLQKQGSLNFSRYNNFLFNTRQNFYAWSRPYSMDGRELLKSSKQGDTFYIATIDGISPTMVYNTRFFDYKEAQE